MFSAKELFDLLPNFNKNETVYKQFIGDFEALELPTIFNITDINIGSIYNSLEWHLRYKQTAIDSARLETASAMFLDIWGATLAIPRPAGYDDIQYLGYIIGEILATVITFPQVVQLFPNEKVYHCLEMGFFTDFSCTDIGVLNPNLPNRIASGVITHERDSVYIYTDDFLTVDPAAIARVTSRKAGGTGIYIGQY